MSHRHRRSVSAVAIAVAVSIPAGEIAARPCWAPPVDAVVVDRFRRPACRWCPGHRGIEYASRFGDPVRAVATGRVTYAGSVAGVRYVVLRHADGRRVTYGNLARTPHRTGDLVRRGAAIGVAAGALHFGVRTGGEYVDPAPYLGRWVRRARLVPVDGRVANAAPPPRLRCRR